MDETLIGNLRGAGLAAEPYRTPDGSGLLILPHGGRVLGLFARGSDENFFWTNPALASAATARAFYAGGGWHNSGGDRTWISPEVDLFYPDYPRLDRYFQPRQLDPGRYEVVRKDGGVQLVNRLTVTLARSKQTIELTLSKTLMPAANPLRHERGLEELASLEYAGYTQQTALARVGGGAARVGAWNLIQMPHGGDLYVPLHARTEPKLYFGTIPAEDLTSSSHCLRYRLRTGGIHKIGIRAVVATGRAGYLYRARAAWALVIRNFTVNPSGEYVDVPPDDLEHLGYAIQACNVVHDELGSFSELEYHVPAIGGEDGCTVREDVSQVWAFRGPRRLVESAARVLLSEEVEVTT